MKISQQLKAFGISFLSSFILFFIIADYIDKKDRGICFDCGEKFGLPFRYLETGGQAFSERFLWVGLIGNILVAIAVSTLIGLLFYFVTRRLFGRSHFN